MSARSNPCQGAKTRRRLALQLAGCLGATALVAAAHAAEAIQGTVRVAPGFAGQIAAGDRLVFKLYHPRAGAELDRQYRTLDDFSLPLDFNLTPSTDMSGRTKYEDYVIEVFTDKDDDVLKVAPGELEARTAEPVPLGTSGLVLELRPRGQ